MRRRFAVLLGVLVVGAGCKKQATDAPEAGQPVADADADADNESPEDEDVEESPYLDAMNFNRVVESHSDQVVACYKDTAGKQPDAPKGRVKATVMVDGDGKVKGVTFDPQRSTLKHDGLHTCLEAAIKGWKFNISLTGADSPMPTTFDLTDGGLLK